MDDKLYIFECEEEEDPYCAHWFETMWMTKDYDECIKRMTDRHNSNPMKLDGVHYKWDGFAGWCKVWSYDPNIKAYKFDKTIWLDRDQITYNDFELSNPDDLIDMLKTDKQAVVLNFKISGQILDVSFERHIETEFRIFEEFQKDQKRYAYLKCGGHCYNYATPSPRAEYFKHLEYMNAEYMKRQHVDAETRDLRAVSDTICRYHNDFLDDKFEDVMKTLPPPMYNISK